MSLFSDYLDDAKNSEAEQRKIAQQYLKKLRLYKNELETCFVENIGEMIKYIYSCDSFNHVWIKGERFWDKPLEVATLSQDCLTDGTHLYLLCKDCSAEGRKRYYRDNRANYSTDVYEFEIKRDIDDILDYFFWIRRYGDFNNDIHFTGICSEISSLENGLAGLRKEIDTFVAMPVQDRVNNWINQIMQEKGRQFFRR